MEYVEIRRKLKDVHSEIFKQKMNDFIYVKNGVKALGLKTKGNTIIFESKSEQEAFWDFLTYEAFDPRNSLFNNAKNNKTLSQEANIFLDKIKVYETALYIAGPKNGNEISITNIHSGDLYHLHDINLSNSNLEGYLIFIRLLKVDEYFMTSGSTYIFTENIPTILKREKILMKTTFKLNRSITRSRVMLKLNRIYGTKVIHEDV
ncbi:MAG: hypothetical protein JXR70_05520 [Spirochaetales bacterium]|nr:hypothetical protein [Spirochaetales bacterium]